MSAGFMTAKGTVREEEGWRVAHNSPPGTEYSQTGRT